MFYNGTDTQPERQILRLSEAYEKRMERPELELLVTVYNINRGNNQELMEACRLLREYAQYVETVREYAKELPFPEAVEKAVDYCIRNGILSDFLSKNRAEAIAVTIFEYDEEKHIKSEREDAYNEGHADGLEEGIEKGIEKGIKTGITEGKSRGEQRTYRLYELLSGAGRSADFNRAVTDEAYREALYKEFNL